MKINKMLLGVACMSTALVSCSDQLNYHEYDNVGKDYISATYERVDGLVSNIYSQLDYDFGESYGGGMLASASDEAVYCNKTASVNTFYNGSWSSVTPMSGQWNASYAAIADCNDFLENFKGLKFEAELYTDKHALHLAQYKRFPFEVKLLRAYFYFLLVRQYGAVPYYTAYLSPDQKNKLPRTPALDVLDSIMTTCDEVVDSLPIDYTNLGEFTMTPPETGRFGRLVALALKARAQLYAASPLFSGKGEGDKERYLKAAQYSQALIDTCAAHKIRIGFYENTWGTSSYMSGARNNAELIYARRVDDFGKPESRNFPVGIASAGAGGNCPSEDLAEAFETKGGYDVTLTDNGFASDDPAFDPQHPFANRDPRFSLIFAVNGEAKWPMSNADPLETYYGGVSGEPKVGATPTGYYLKKLLDGTIDLSSTGTKKGSYHSWMTFRLGEFYLNYAEAAFKATGSANVVPEGCKLTATAAVNVLRRRVKVVMPNLPATLSNDLFWEKYKKERFVELCFEGHRFYDVRRWKEADKYLKRVKLLKIIKNDDGTFTYKPDYQEREWNDKMYLFPIPQSDIIKSGGALKQNPGWE